MLQHLTVTGQQVLNGQKAVVGYKVLPKRLLLKNNEKKVVKLVHAYPTDTKSCFYFRYYPLLNAAYLQKRKKRIPFVDHILPPCNAAYVGGDRVRTLSENLFVAVREDEWSGPQILSVNINGRSVPPILERRRGKVYMSISMHRTTSRNGYHIFKVTSPSDVRIASFSASPAHNVRLRLVHDRAFTFCVVNDKIRTTPPDPGEINQNILTIFGDMFGDEHAILLERKETIVPYTSVEATQILQKAYNDVQPVVAEQSSPDVNEETPTPPERSPQKNRRLAPGAAPISPVSTPDTEEAAAAPPPISPDSTPIAVKVEAAPGPASEPSSFKKVSENEWHIRNPSLTIVPDNKKVMPHEDVIVASGRADASLIKANEATFRGRAKALIGNQERLNEILGEPWTEVYSLNDGDVSDEPTHYYWICFYNDSVILNDETEVKDENILKKLECCKYGGASVTGPGTSTSIRNILFPYVKRDEYVIRGRRAIPNKEIYTHLRDIEFLSEKSDVNVVCLGETKTLLLAKMYALKHNLVIRLDKNYKKKMSITDSLYTFPNVESLMKYEYPTPHQILLHNERTTIRFSTMPLKEFNKHYYISDVKVFVAKDQKPESIFGLLNMIPNNSKVRVIGNSDYVKTYIISKNVPFEKNARPDVHIVMQNDNKDDLQKCLLEYVHHDVFVYFFNIDDANELKCRIADQDKNWMTNFNTVFSEETDDKRKEIHTSIIPEEVNLTSFDVPVEVKVEGNGRAEDAVINTRAKKRVFDIDRPYKGCQVALVDSLLRPR